MESTDMYKMEVPQFNGQNGLKYEIWSNRMKTFLQAQGCDIWRSVVTGYTTTKKPLKTATKKELKRNNKITMDFIMEGLPDSVKNKVGQCASTKELWDNLQDIYARKGTKENEAGDNSDDEEVNRGEYFFFNCEEVGHIEIECPYLKIGSDETKNPNEIEDNPEIEKEKNHEDREGISKF
jgi:hypothetical protein